MSVAEPGPRPGNVFADAVDSVRRGEADVDTVVGQLIGRLTDTELLWLLDGDLQILRGVREMSQG